MLAWLFPSPADRRLIGGNPLRGATPWVIAIMSFSIVIVAAAGLALANTAGMVARSTEHRYSVQLPGGGVALAPVVGTLRSTPGVTAVEAVPEREMRQTLARWLGPQVAASSELPVPALVNFDVDPGSDTGAIERRVKAVAPQAMPRSCSPAAPGGSNMRSRLSLRGRRSGCWSRAPTRRSPRATLRAASAAIAG
jgi:cell division transport system permease protein